VDSFEQINAYLIKKLEADPYYSDQLSKVMECPDFMLDQTFLGFVDTYYHLSKIIPTGRTVYDLGCCAAVQGWFFKNHKKYVAVDFETSPDDVFRTPNMEFHNCTIREFIEDSFIEEPHFAICNYVPPWQDDNMELVRRAFNYLYVFYPEAGDEPEDETSRRVKKLSDKLPQKDDE